MLGDPGRRALYDRSLERAEVPAPPAGPVATGSTTGAPAVHPASRFPWRGFAAATTVAVVAVAAASLLADPPAPAPPDGILRPGSCVTIEPNTDARETTCTGSGDIVVEVVVPIGAACPLGTEPHRDHQGQGTACLLLPH